MLIWSLLLLGSGFLVDELDRAALEGDRVNQGQRDLMALVNGQLADQFTGALPEDQIREWLAQFQPSPAELLVLEARKLEQEDSAAARCMLEDISLVTVLCSSTAAAVEVTYSLTP